MRHLDVTPYVKNEKQSLLMRDWVRDCIKGGALRLRGPDRIIDRVIFTDADTIDENYLLFVLRYGEVDYVDSVVKKPELTGSCIT